MATITVTCIMCNLILVEAEGPDLNEEDALTYGTSCQCFVHGPFQTYDASHNPIPMDYSNISSVLDLT